MKSIENEKICVSVNKKGAELTSIYHKTRKLEYLWQADPAFWGKHAPVLFPVIGEMLDGEYIYNEKVYTMTKHGFARDYDFILIQEGPEFLEYELKANQETMSCYPFDFSLRIRYTLEGENVHSDYSVQNNGDEPVFYSLGTHPAFNWPLVPGESFGDYHLRFSHTENLERLLTNIETGIRNLKRRPVIENARSMELNHSLFYDDAILLEYPVSKWIRFESKKSGRFVQLSMEGFTHMGIWTKPNDAPFLCVEPWQGLCDRQDTSKQLHKKEGIQRIEPGGTSHARMTISIG